MSESTGESVPSIAPQSPPKDNTSLAEISSWWEVPCIAQYCLTFSDSLELPTFEIEELEIALLPSDENTDIHPLIVNIHVAFLKGILEKKEIGPTNWELLLRLHFVWRSEFLNEKYNPMGEVSYKLLDTRTKVEILYRLCHLRMELDDVTECIKYLEAYEMRSEDLGVDRRGNKLWYFYGMRLYRESKEAQQHNKRYKGSSSLRSRSADSQKKDPATPNIKSKNSTPRTRNKNQLRAEIGDLEEDSCASADETCKQTPKRITRSAILTSKLANGTTQDNTDGTQTDIPITDTATTSSDTTLFAGDNEYSRRTGWSIVCTDLKDWDQLLSSMEKSSHNCEVEFVKYVRKELLDTLTELDNNKKTNGMLTESDSSIRASRRLNSKIKPSYSSEQIDFTGVPEHPRNNRSVELESISMDELVASESDSIDTEVEEERKREREEVREKRMLEWKEAYSGNIQGPRKKANLPNSATVVDMEEVIIGEDLRIAMLKVVDELRKHEDCWLFVDPVTEAIAPGYHDVIKHPMDIVTVEKKLKNEEYSNKEQFVRDFKIMFKNCRRYNGPDSEYTEMAHTIRQQFNRLFCKHFSQPGPNGRARSPIPGIGSSSDSEGEVTPFKSPVVKRRRKRKTEVDGSMIQKSKTPKRPRGGTGEDQTGYSRYPPPFYPPYPPYSDTDTGHKYPHFPHEFPPFSYFPPFMSSSSSHPPFPAYPPYWGAEHQYKSSHRGAATEGYTAGSTKQRREEEAKLQTVIRSQGLLGNNVEVKQKRERVSSTTAEQKTAELSSPESLTPVTEQTSDPVTQRGDIGSRTSSSSSAGQGFPPLSHRAPTGPYHTPGPYGHMQHPYHNPYYPPYMDYMMDSYYPPSPFFPRQGHYPPPPSRHHRKHKHTEKPSNELLDKCDGVASVGDSELREQQQQQQQQQQQSIENIQDKQTQPDLNSPEKKNSMEMCATDSIRTPNPSPDQFSSLDEANTSLKAVSPTNMNMEEQPHSTTEEVITDIDKHKSIPQIVKQPPSPSNSPDTSYVKATSSKSKPPFPCMYPHRQPYPPIGYPYYPPSPYPPMGYPHPSYDPYLADMMAWNQQQTLSQGTHPSKKKSSRTLPPSQMDPRYYPNSSEYMHRLPPFPGAPQSPEDISPYSYPSAPPHLSKYLKKSHYETDVLPPPAGYCLQPDLLKLPQIDDPTNSNVPNYKDSLADYALHLAGGKPSNLTADPPTQEQISEDTILSPLSVSSQQIPLSTHVNNNNNNNNTELNLESIGSSLFDSVSVNYPPSYPTQSYQPYSASRPNTLRSFFLPSVPPAPHRTDLKLDLLKCEQNRFSQWLARNSIESMSRLTYQMGQRVQSKQDTPEAANTTPEEPSEP